VSWAGLPGLLPADTQARMYNRLTPLFRNVGPAQLVPSTDGSGYVKSEALLPENDPSFMGSDVIGANAPPAPGRSPPRSNATRYGVPHIYSATDAGVIFGAGYVEAQDRSVLIDQARAVRPARQGAVPPARGPQLALRPAARRPVRRLAPVHVEGPARDARRARARRLPPALLRRRQGGALLARAVGGARRRRRAAAAQGPDPAAWHEPASTQQMTFSPLPLIRMQYTNRPSGIQQVVQFGP
jgi:hypothetical protein